MALALIGTVLTAGSAIIGGIVYVVHQPLLTILMSLTKSMPAGKLHTLLRDGGTLGILFVVAIVVYGWCITAFGLLSIADVRRMVSSVAGKIRR